MESTSSKGNILIVDDLPENLHLLNDLLVQLGYTVRTITSGLMAIKSIKLKQPDLVLLDIILPDIDGYEVCKQIKNDEELQDVPIIFISALDDTLDKVKAFQCGGVDYISKPFRIQEVAARLENQLTIQRQKKILQQEVKKRKETEQILSQSRALLASILNTSLDGIAALEPIRNLATGEIEDFSCLVANPIFAKIFKSYKKYSKDKNGGFQAFCNAFDNNLFDKIINVLETGESLELDICLQNNQSTWYQFIVVKLGDAIAMTIRDITARKKVELEFEQANKKLAVLATVDGLTGIGNRRSFDNFLALQWSKHYRDKQPLTLIFIDIDFFKDYNDYYGHQMGDQCLIQVATMLNSLVQKETGLVARYGGEEFSIFLCDTDKEKARLVAEKVMQAIADLEIPHARSAVSCFVTLSLGIASLIPGPEDNINSLIKNADRALYRAKDQGRNRIVVFGEDDRPPFSRFPPYPPKMA